ncbi:MAG: hypothetical protein UT34_C0001G0374 [candidate division WS6 bacterium GW2011_GWF2_39_15]|uniref:Uncharacterized protein n=1 Tax=candidate division WS6 bacterium GW2011_GWF2_39_15 TaxID=1619100 RepID=A0A0G0MQM6_9BACT|nr:MAG: hypothetical protein UT34_C0001G0374 [candidate division WS6 bacterium GW2011_GWF2_39_15]
MPDELLKGTPKYLTARDWDSEGEDSPLTVYELLNQELIYSPAFLIRGLQKAWDVVVNTPGENLEVRIKAADDWFGWWIAFFTQYMEKEETLMTNSTLIPATNVFSFENVGLKSEGSLRIINFMGKSEGLGHHRYTMDDFLSIEFLMSPDLIVLLEPDSYIRNQQRKERYIPLGMGVSMWSLYLRYGQKGRITVIPDKYDRSPGSFNESNMQILKDIDADYIFPSPYDHTGSLDGTIKGRYIRTLNFHLPASISTSMALIV